MSTQNLNFISLAREVIPQEVYDAINTSSIEGFDQRNAASLSETFTIFLLKLIQESSNAFRKGELKQFDANPGDRGCQLRGLLIRKLSLDPTLGEELQSCSEAVKALLVQAKKCHSISEKMDFFKSTIETFKVSPKMAFFLECYLLTITKVPKTTFPSGLIITASDIQRFEMLSPKMSQVDKVFRLSLLGNTQRRVSQKSIQRLCDEVGELKIEEEEKKNILEMLSPSRIRQGNVSGFFSTKSFGCLFSEIKSVLLSLRQNQALIAVKTIVPKGKNSEYIFFQAKTPGGEFELIDDISSVSPDEKIVVFEGIVQEGLSISELKLLFQKISFSSVILACASISEPFEPGSTIEMIDHAPTKKEILEFQKIADQIGLTSKKRFFDLDHVFCNSLKKENFSLK